MAETSKHQRVREQQLLPTLEFCAAKVPFYRELWGNEWQKVQRISDLHRLPLLDKKRAIAAQAELRSGVEPIGAPVLSSGTSREGDDVLQMLHSNAELEQQDRYLELLAETDAEAAGGANATASSGQLDLSGSLPPRRELVVVNAHHGLPFERSSQARLLVPFSAHPNALLQIERLLQRTFDDDTRIEAMLISVDNLKALTLWMSARGVDPASFAVRDIGTNSSTLSGPWRARLSKLWNAQLWDNYTLSELRSPASECGHCGHFHFDQVPVVFEIVDPLSGLPRDDWGELVLTTLYPYAQAMPLVRFRSGDLFALDNSCDTGEVGLAFLGRAESCGLRRTEDGSAQLLFAPGPLLDFIDASPDFALRPHPLEQLAGVPPRSIGEPWLEVTTDDSGARTRVWVRARLRYEPAVFPDRAHALRDALASSLMHALPTLEEEVAAGGAMIEVELLGPET